MRRLVIGSHAQTPAGGSGPMDPPSCVASCGGRVDLKALVGFEPAAFVISGPS